jgi:hypothetical protein
MRLITGAIALLGASFITATSAQAAPIVIGTFYFIDNPPLGGSVVVENLSNVPGMPDDFNEIVVELELVGGGTEEYGYGEVGVLGPEFVLGGPSNPLFTFSPLGFSPGSNTAALDLPDPTLYVSASLVLDFKTFFVDNTAPIAIQDGASSPIRIPSVPEPATLLLVGSTLVAGFRRRIGSPTTR